MIYDETADYVDTPGGLGKFVEFDGKTGVVTVEMDNQYLVFYPGDSCYILETF